MQRFADRFKFGDRFGQGRRVWAAARIRRIYTLLLDQTAALDYRLAPSENSKAMIVLTDGKENTAPFIASVKDAIITDGVKIFLKDGWVIIRPSGTEPIFRVFSESKTKKTAEEIGLKFCKLVENIIKNEK